MNHTARFYVDEAGLAIGARSPAAVTDYLRSGGARIERPAAPAPR
ncbi:MAG: hypothetical protein U1F18_08290 [Steroidobacteraceae bacterium]